MPGCRAGGDSPRPLCQGEPSGPRLDALPNLALNLVMQINFIEFVVAPIFISVCVWVGVGVRVLGGR